MITVWALLALATVSAGPANLIPGDAGFTTGPGPFSVVDSLALGARTRWLPGELRLPSPGPLDRAGAALVLPQSAPLAAGQSYTFACRARADREGVVLRLTARDPFGRGASANYRLQAGWQVLRLGFTSEPLPTSPETARALGVDWSRRPETIPAEAAAQPFVRLEAACLPHAGEGREAWLDAVWLTPADETAEPAEPPLLVDATWSDGQPNSPLWRHRPELTITASGPPGQVTGLLTLADPAGNVWFSHALLPAPANTWRLQVPHPPGGPHQLSLTANANDKRAESSRWLLILSDLTDPGVQPGPFSYAAEAVPAASFARRLGYQRVRLVRTWAELADAEGQADAAALERLRETLGPALAAGGEITLAVALTPTAAIPAGARTARKMDSHGYDKGTVLGDLERLAGFAGDLARAFAGLGLVYELEQAAWQRWHAADYVAYLRRFRESVLAVDPFAQVAGAQITWHAADQKLAALVDEVAKRDGLELVERLGLAWPFDLTAAPEPLGQATAAALHARLDAESPPPRVQITASRTAAPGPWDPEAPRWAHAGQLGKATSPAREAAHWLRGWLAAVRLDPAVYPVQWRGGSDAVDAVANHWQRRYAGARHVTDLSLGGPLAGVLLELPDGPGLAAVWDTSDTRWSLRQPPPGDGPSQLLWQPASATLRACTMYGQPLPLATGDTAMVGLSFQPVYLAAPTVELLERLLAVAQVRRGDGLRLALGLTSVRGFPALAAWVGNLGREPVAGQVRAATGEGIDLVAAEGWYHAAGHDQAEVVLPLARWQRSREAVTTVTMVAEAGRRIVSREFEIVRLLEPEAPVPLRLDAAADDWPALATTLHLTGADRLTDPAADWQGPEDGSLTARLLFTGDSLALHVEVNDDQLAVGVTNPFDQGDAVELILDFDPASEGSQASSALYRIVLTPTYDGVVQGRWRVTRGATNGPAMVDDKAVAGAVRQRIDGWHGELLLPLTADGRRQLLTQRVFGCQVLLHDTDTGMTRDWTLARFGNPTAATSGTAAAACWLAERDWETLEPQAVRSAEPAVALGRWGFDPADQATRWEAVPGAGSRVRPVRRSGFVREGWGLGIDRHADTMVTAARLWPELPLHGGPVELQFWVRRSPTAAAAPELRVDWGETGAWFTVGPAWERFGLRLERRPPADQPIILDVRGSGGLELAELALAPAPPVPLLATARGAAAP